MADLTELATAMGVQPESLHGLDSCNQAGIDRLTTLVHTTFAREDEEVEAGLKATLNAVPRPLRGKARSLLFGDDR